MKVTDSHSAPVSYHYLGFKIICDGIAPLENKVDAITKFVVPKHNRDLRKFVGIVNYYRDVWPGRAHTMTPLPKLIGKTAKFCWTEEHQKAFYDTKRKLAEATLLVYLDYNVPFGIFVNASTL